MATDEEGSTEDNSESLDDDQLNIADLAGFTPEEQHRSGIVALLNQMFRNNSINVSTIADIIIEKKLGAVITLSQDDDDDDDDDDSTGVFVVTAALNFQGHKSLAGIKELRTFLLKLCEEYGTSDAYLFAEHVTKPESPKTCLFLVNEKMINLPPEFTAVPIPYVEEIKMDDTGPHASITDNDDTIICILKLYKKSTEDALCYMHPEQKVFSDLATWTVDYPINLTEFGSIFIEGEGEDDPDEDCPPFRRICFISKNIFQTTCITQLNEQIEQLKAT